MPTPRTAGETAIIALMSFAIGVPPFGDFGLNMQFRIFSDGGQVRSLHAVLAFGIDINVSSIAERLSGVDPNIRIASGFTVETMLIVNGLLDRFKVRISDLYHLSC